MFAKSPLFAGLALLASANATLFLEYPAAIGIGCRNAIDSKSQQLNPCGGFNPADRTNVTAFPVAGIDLTISTTESSSWYYFKAALLEDLNNWVEIRSSVRAGADTYTIKRVRGSSNESWVGQDAVLQISQYVGNGVINYQCAAIKFVTGPYVQAPSNPQGRSIANDEEKRQTAVLNATTTTSGRNATSTPVRVSEAGALLNSLVLLSPIIIVSAIMLSL